MIEKLINEIHLALDNNLYLVALNTALTLPDICGKAKYPDKKTTERYKLWYEEYVGQYERCPDENDDMPYLSADVVYQLRCSLSHQGNPNIEKEKTGIDNFQLLIESKNEFEIYADHASLSSNFSENKTKNYRVSVRRLCFILCTTAKAYYSKHKEQFDFFNFTIFDIEKEMKRLKPYIDSVNHFLEGQK